MSDPGAPVRLLKFVTLFGFGGTERQVVNLVRGLDRSRFDPRFACLKRWGHFLNDIEDQQIPIAEYRISSLYKPGTFWQQLQLAGHLRRNQIQIAHSYNFYANTFAVPAARLAGVPVVVASIRDTGLGVTPAKMRVHKWVCRLADCVLVNAEAVRQWLIGQGYRADKVAVIRNGIDLSSVVPSGTGAGLRRELGLPQDARLVVVLARLVPSKGIETFLEAAAAVGEGRPDVRFLLVGEHFVSGEGDGAALEVEYKESLKQLASRFGIGERVLFTGYRPDVADVLAQSAVSVLPSINGEGLPNAVLESMAAGVPVVATRVGGTAEVIERDGVEGLLVPPKEPAALARAIGAVLDDRELALRLGQEGRRRVVGHFSLDRMVRATEDLYAQLLENAARGRAAYDTRRTAER